MRRAILMMASMSVLAACSGGGGDDRSSSMPVVSLSASSTTVEGGETVVFSATATDAAKASLPVTITCNGGTLTGNILVTARTDTDGTITCTGTASDSSGRQGTGTATITVKKTVAVMELANKPSMVQGEFGALMVDGIALPETSYQGKLGDQTITLYRGSASSLNFVIPTNLAPGSYPLSVQIGQKQYSFTLQISPSAAQSSARQTVSTEINRAISQIDSLLASDGSQMTDNQKGIYQGYREQLNTALTQLGGMSEADVTTLAQLITPNIGAPNAAQFSAVEYDDAACNSSMVRFLAAKNLAAVRLITGLALIVIPDATLTKLAGLVVFIQAAAAIEEAKASVQNLVNKCVDEQQFDLEAANNVQFQALVPATTVGATFGFDNKVSKSFRLKETKRLNDSVADKIQSGFKQLVDLIAQLPYVPDSLSNVMTDFAREKVTYIPASAISLDSVSNSSILGAKGGSGDTISLVFSYVGDPPSDNVPFSFTLSTNAEPLTFGGQLSIKLPSAEDAAVTTIQGKAVSSQLQVLGAESIEVVQAAAHGTATIGIDGLLSYTPSGEYFGTDQVLFRARNSNGVSRTATVLLTINRQFEGTWNIHSVSTTTSQSQPGLCPNEDTNLTAYVSKVSDTQYTTTIDGVTLNFTMASKDDPAGLKGSISGTYDDGPGETTESLSVSIPNSSQLYGTSIWSYEGPENTSCRGNTQITGTKQN